MQAVRIYEYNQPPRLVDIPTPETLGPFDVIVRIAGAGVCRTDLHLIEGIWRERLGNPKLPYTLGHENSGWVEDVGSGVPNLSKGEPVILHPLITCGVCRACRDGNDMHCVSAKLPGLDGTDGGYAQYMKTNVRCIIKLAPGIDPAPLAPFADAGLTAYHAVKKILPFAVPGAVVVVIGIGGLGHFAIQILRAMSATKIVAVDTASERLRFAEQMGADHVVLSKTDGGVLEVLALTGGGGADVVLDFVGEHSTPANGLRMIRKGGLYSIIGYGGELSDTTLDMISRELTVMGNLVGSYNELVELMELNRQGEVRVSSNQFALSEAPRVLNDLSSGKIVGRAVLTPK